MPRNNIITNRPDPASKSTGYVTFNDQTKSTVLAKYGNNVNKFESVQKQLPIQTAKADITPSNSTFNTLNTRAPYWPETFYLQRMWQMLPVTFRDVVYACRLTYLRMGIVRNIIDMLTDFASEGLKFTHPDKKVEAFFRVWGEKVKINDAVDEFIRHLLVDGNVCVKRTTAKLSKPVKEQWTEHTVADKLQVGVPSVSPPTALNKQAYEISPEEDPNTVPPVKLYKESKVSKNEIPWQYHFINVCALYWIGGEYESLTGERRLAFKISDTLFNKLRGPQNPFQQLLYSQIPTGIKKPINGGYSDLIPLDMDTIYIGHNKKDSWEDWAPPFMYSILSDVQFRDKLRQAETSALDGLINVIRLWKLGDHKEGMLPGEAGIDKLVSILEANTGGGAIDIVWDSMIDMKEYYPPVGEILGTDKYKEVDRDILIGLGVPEVLIGGEGGKFSNSFIQLKTFVQRLKYIREKVTEWLTQEVAIVCDAVDIKISPFIRFNDLNAEDENTQKKLILGLLDRNIISVEAVLEAYGQNFLLEIERMKDEKALFKSAKVDVIGPFDPVAPKQTQTGGPNNSPNKTQTPAKPPGQPGQGRPPATQNDGPIKRNPKPMRGKSKGYSIFALDAIDAIDELVVPKYMEGIGVANARKLTNQQKDDINDIRMGILSCLTPNSDISEASLLKVADDISNGDRDIVNDCENSIREFITEKGVEPTVAQRKRIEAISWANYYSNLEENDNA